MADGARTITELYQALKPLLLRDFGAVSVARSAGGGMEAHALNGPWHLGTLAEAQAPFAATKTELGVHAANPDAHHGQVHALVGADHTASGLTAGWVVRASGPASFAWAQPQHADLGGVTANQHHNQVHSITGTDHTISGSQFQLVGATAPNVLGLLTPSSDPGAAAAILRSSASGELTLPLLTATTRVRTPLLDTESGALTVQPAGDLQLQPGSSVVRLMAGRTIQSDGYASQATGMRVTHGGEGDFRYLFADEMHVKTFVADLEQALAGGQIISKSVAVVAAAFTLPGAGSTGTLRVRDLPSAPNMAVFQSGDFVGMRQFSRSGGSLTVGWAWGTVTGYADQADGTQTWTFTRHATTPGSAGGTIAADSLVLDFGVTGNGFYEVNAIDGMYGANSPYWRVVTWATHPATQTVRVQGGNLRGLFSVANEYGFYAGDGTGTGNTYLRLSNAANEFRNLSTTWYAGGSPFLAINATDGISIASSVTGTSDQRAVTFYDGANTTGGLWAEHVASGQIDLTLGVGYGATTRTSRLTLLAVGGTNRREIALNVNGASITLLHNEPGATNTVAILGASGVTINGGTAWHSGNDGSGSGLDADLLDGIHAASFALLSGAYFAGNVAVPTLTVNHGGVGGIVLNGTVNVSWTYVINNQTGGYLSIESQAPGAAPFVIDTWGNIGIGRTSPGAALDVNGRILVTTTGYDWSSLTPQNNWANQGAPNPTFGIKRFGTHVSVKGVVKANSAIASLTAVNAQLVAEYRPATGRSFACVASIGGVETIRRVYVDSAGYIRPVGAYATNDWLALEFSYYTGG